MFIRYYKNILNKMEEQDLEDWDKHFNNSKREMEKMGLGIDGFRIDRKVYICG